MLRRVINNNIKRHFQISLCNYRQPGPTYEQGQSPEPTIREYFYYIDHQGMVGEIVVWRFHMIIAILYIRVWITFA